MHVWNISCNIIAILAIIFGSWIFKSLAISILIFNTIKPAYIIYNEQKFKYNIRKAIKDKQREMQSRLQKFAGHTEKEGLPEN